MEKYEFSMGGSFASLVDMAVNGSRVYKEALDNIKWLEGMAGSITGSRHYSI
jgi:hypothetical protein